MKKKIVSGILSIITVFTLCAGTIGAAASAAPAAAAAVGRAAGLHAGEPPAGVLVQRQPAAAAVAAVNHPFPGDRAATPGNRTFAEPTPHEARHGGRS